MRIKKGMEVRLADGREGVCRSVTRTGVVEVRCYGGGVVFSHVSSVVPL
jgi:hypothetical protein